MANETNIIEVQLDIGEAITNTEELSDVLDGLKQSANIASTAMSKIFASLQVGMKSILATAGAVSSTVSELVTKLNEVKTTKATAFESKGLFQEIADGYNSVIKFLDGLEKLDKNSGKLYNALADPLTAPNASSFFDSMFPNTTDLVSAVHECVTKKVLPAFGKAFKSGSALMGGDASSIFVPITEAFNGVSELLGGELGGAKETIQNIFANMPDLLSNTLSGVADSLQGVFGNISGIFSGMSLGWGAAIAGIITLIVLLVQNWDTVQAAIITAWEAIQAAVGTAAEWLNTNVIQPVVGFFAEAWNAVTAVFAVVGAWFDENVIQPIIGVFAPIVAWFGTLFGGIWQTVSDVFYNIGVIISGCWEILQAVWGIVAEWFNTNVIQPVATFFSGLWAGICDFAKGAWEGIVGVFSAVATWFDTNVIQPVASFFRGMWDGFIKAATDAWNAVVVVFSAVAGFFGDIFSQAWSAVVAVFSIAGEIFNNIKDGILTVFISIVNGLITGINSVVRIPFDGINGAISTIRAINIFDIQPFSGLRTINVPQIPYLAKGAVLPANRPFLAVVGDQRHGTNIEAPLATIQEAVAVVMEDHISAMMSGFQALLEENRMLRQTVAAIEVGDDTIGQAAARYNSKMAIVRGGLF